MNNKLLKCKNCKEGIEEQVEDCQFCEDCCYENQMSWQVK